MADIVAIRQSYMDSKMSQCDPKIGRQRLRQRSYRRREIWIAPYSKRTTKNKSSSLHRSEMTKKGQEGWHPNKKLQGLRVL